VLLPPGPLGAHCYKYVMYLWQWDSIDSVFVELSKRETLSHNAHPPFIEIGDAPP
jgi:hypothetical protein